jgi:hypothetical protein
MRGRSIGELSYRFECVGNLARAPNVLGVHPSAPMDADHVDLDYEHDLENFGDDKAMDVTDK